MFTHLHCHSYYSMLDGLPSPEEIVGKAKHMGHEAVAITDHGSIHNFLEFYKEANEQDIKPIIGIEFYITSTFANIGLSKEEDAYHLIAWAKNDEGLKNIFELVTFSNTEGFYYKPRITFEKLKQHKEGLIISSACLGGEISKLLLNDQYSKAKEVAEEYQSVFKEDFYLEIMSNNLKDQYNANNKLVKLHKDTGIKLVATNDIHYLEPTDYKVQDIMLAIGTGAKLNDPNRFKFEGDQFYYKSKDQVERDLFKGSNHIGYAKEAIKNTQEIVNKIEDYDIETGNLKLPPYETPGDMGLEKYLEQIAYKKLFELSLEKEIDIKKYSKRLDHELKVINNKGYPGYFLVVSDFMKWAKNNGVAFGPARGSAGGSLLSYLLDIISFDPLEYDLLFSRFLNPERTAMPDQPIAI